MAIPIEGRELAIPMKELLSHPGEDLHVVVNVLTDEEYELYQGFMNELNVEAGSGGLGLLLKDYQRVIDALWDEKLSRPSAALDALAAEAQAEADAGRTLDLTPDMLNDEV